MQTRKLDSDIRGSPDQPTLLGTIAIIMSSDQSQWSQDNVYRVALTRTMVVLGVAFLARSLHQLIQYARSLRALNHHPGLA